MQLTFTFRPKPIFEKILNTNIELVDLIFSAKEFYVGSP